MSGSGKAGGGRGYNRKRQFRRRGSDSWQDGGYQGNSNNYRNEASGRNNNPADSSPPDRRNPARGQPHDNRGDNRHDNRFDNRNDNRQGGFRRGGDNFRRARAPYIERPKWTPPKLNTDPLPVPDCPWCGKPIRDISTAMSDKDTGVPVHFDCVAARIAGTERLENGDIITYIGGGRFGIVNPGASGHPQSVGRGPVSAGNDFRIKKIIEWENKDNRAGWRSEICDHYSVT